MSDRLTPSDPVPAHTTAAPTGGRKPSPLHPAEAALVAVTAAHLCFLPWALGTMHAWSQLTSLAMAVIGLALAALPRPSPGLSGRDVFSWPAGGLVRWPPFLAGVAVCGLIVLQGLNPAWQYASNADSWWLEPLNPISWLPAGVEAPFGRFNPWRMLIIYGSTLLLASSVWIGFTRRKSFRILFTLLVGNAVVLALLGLIQRLDGTQRILWTHLPSNDRFIASFIYPNHAGPYFNLMTGLAAGLAWWCCRRTGRQFRDRAWPWFFIFAATLTGLLVLNTYSRMSVFLLAVFGVIFGGMLAFHAFRRSGNTVRNPAMQRSALTALAAAAVLAVVLGAQPLTKVRARFAEAASLSADNGLDRRLVRQATLDMVKDRWLFGWGAGCFRHGFPLYAKNYPEIYHSGANGRKYWEHAHNDWLQIPAELGITGALLLIAGLGYVAHRLVRRRFWQNPVPLALVCSCALLLLHAWVDFVGQNPAVLLTWAVLLLGALRWQELDQPATGSVSG